MELFKFSDFITKIYSTINTFMNNGIDNLQGPLMLTLTLLAALSIMTTWEMYFGNYNYGNLIVKLLHIGFVGAMIKGWVEFVDILKESAINLGNAFNTSSVQDIGKFIDKKMGAYFDVYGTILDQLALDSSLIIVLVASIVILVGICGILYIGYSVFSATAEFMIVSKLMIVLVPFQVLGYTKEFGNKAWGGLLTLVVKLMVTTFFFALVASLVDSTLTIAADSVGSSEDVDKNLPAIITQTCALIFLAFLSKHAVALTSSIVSGAAIATGNPMGDAISRGGGAVAGYATGAAKGTAKFGGRVAGKVAMGGARIAGRGIKKGATKMGNAVYNAGHKRGWW